MSKAPGTRLISRIAILAAVALAVPLSAQARGGGGGGGGAGGFGGGFHGGAAGFHAGLGGGAFRGGIAFAPHAGFRAAPRFAFVPNRRFHDGVAFRVGSFARSRAGLSTPGIPPLRGMAVPPLSGVAVPPFQGSFRSSGPEIWRRGPDGIWNHRFGVHDGGRLSPGVVGFGWALPAFGVPLAYAPSGYGYGAPAFGATCNAAPYLCPIDPAAPVGAPCACPVEGGRLAPGLVE